MNSISNNFNWFNVIVWIRIGCIAFAWSDIPKTWNEPRLAINLKRKDRFLMTEREREKGSIYTAEDVAGRRLKINSVFGRLAWQITLNLKLKLLKSINQLFKHTLDHFH